MITNCTLTETFLKALTMKKNRTIKIANINYHLEQCLSESGPHATTLCPSSAS